MRKIIFKSVSSKSQKIWSTQEDKELLSLVNKNKRNNWYQISQHFKNKTIHQCLSRYQRIRPDIEHKSFTREEDEKLLEWFRNYGSSWRKIAKELRNRNCQQVKNRYSNVLNPKLNKGPFTFEEKKLLMQLTKILGNKWVKISKLFSNRSAELIKKRYYSMVRQNKKKKVSCQEIPLNVSFMNSSNNSNLNFWDNNSEKPTNEQSDNLVISLCNYINKDIFLSKNDKEINNFQNEYYYDSIYKFDEDFD